MDWYLDVLKTKYAAFSGRARRKEYWMFTLVNVLIYAGLVIVGRIVGIDALLAGVYGLAVLLPSLAVGVRRLHDTDRSGWWLLLGLIPVLGLVLLIFMCIEGNTGDNQYGASPKAAGA